MSLFCYLFILLFLYVMSCMYLGCLFLSLLVLYFFVYFVILLYLHLFVLVMSCFLYVFLCFFIMFSQVHRMINLSFSKQKIKDNKYHFLKNYYFFTWLSHCEYLKPANILITVYTIKTYCKLELCLSPNNFHRTL